MRKAGIYVQHDETLSWFHVPQGEYQPFSERIPGDFTSASYFLAAASLFEGTTILRNISEHSLQGEKAMVTILRELGVACRFDFQSQTLTVKKGPKALAGKYEFDVRDCPNIVPTLATLGSYVDGVLRIVGASITRLHKSPRAEAMVSELRKVGVDINLICRNGLVDGFEVRGRDRYEGGQVLSSWRDHRIFMALFVASLRHANPNLIDGYDDVDCSFPTFFEQFTKNGIGFDTVDGPASHEHSDRLQHASSA
jgi:3-phosphoshikimate 1-carboxyvinyltransferase